MAEVSEYPSAAAFIRLGDEFHHSLCPPVLVFFQEIVGPGLEVQIARHQPFVFDEKHVRSGCRNISDQVQLGHPVELFPELRYRQASFCGYEVFIYARGEAENSGVAPHHKFQYPRQERVVKLVVI